MFNVIVVVELWSSLKGPPCFGFVGRWAVHDFKIKKYLHLMCFGPIKGIIDFKAHGRLVVLEEDFLFDGVALCLNEEVSCV